MVVLDLLVVATALSTIRRDLGASIGQLEWTVNAYTLAFAVLLMTAATLGDRFGRRRVFAAGLGVFAAGSAACALAPGVGALIVARAVQGTGAAMIMPLALALLNAAVRGSFSGWASPEVTGTLAAGGLLLVAFVAWELRARAPMLPMRLFASRGFSAGNITVFLWNASLTGAIFFTAQFLQVSLGLDPLSAGLRLLPWGWPRS
jgi:MFS family permease